MEKQSRLPSIIFGSIIILFALGFLMNLLGHLDVNSVLGNFWPILVVFLGLFVMSLPNNDVIGVGIAFFGFFLLINQLGLVDSQTKKQILIGCLILLGLVVLAFGSDKAGRSKR